RSDCALPEQSFSYSCKMAPLRSVFLLTSLAASVSALREEMREPVEDVACCAMFSEGEDTNVACVALEKQKPCPSYDKLPLEFSATAWEKCNAWPEGGIKTCKELSE
ncbi:unnamed protein product, partial [Effrenium voratum]